MQVAGEKRSDLGTAVGGGIYEVGVVLRWLGRWQLWCLAGLGGEGEPSRKRSASRASHSVVSYLARTIRE